MRVWRIVLVVLLVAGAGVWAWAKWHKPAPKQIQTRKLITAPVHKGSLEVTLRVQGVIFAAENIQIICQVPNTQVTWALTDGTTVKAGDTIITLNDTPLKKSLTDQETQNADAEETARNTLANAARTLQNAKTALVRAKEDLRLQQMQSKASSESAQADLDFQKEAVNVAEGNYERYKRLYEEHLVRKDEVDGQAEEVRKATFGLEKSLRDFERRKKDIETGEKLKQLSIEKAELEVKTAEADLAQTVSNLEQERTTRQEKLAEVKAQLNNVIIKTSTSGMLQLDQVWSRSSMSQHALMVGDSVNEGQQIASIIDPTRLQVACNINETDIERVAPNQKVIVRVPAIGGEVLYGNLSSVDNLAREMDVWEGGLPGKRTFSAAVKFSKGDKRLRPGMGATIEIVVKTKHDGLSVPIEAVFSDHGKNYVYCYRGQNYCRTEVKPGLRDELSICVEGMLSPKDRVACERPPANLLAGDSVK
jgi:HlyD family secretion protein